jgi:transposase-like protein
MTLQLDRAAGPECPKCGCNGVTLESAGDTRGKPWAKFRCTHCDQVFSIGFSAVTKDTVVNGVVYHRVKCPTCQSKNTEITRTASEKIRYHKCRDCGQNFKSVEA